MLAWCQSASYCELLFLQCLLSLFIKLSVLVVLSIQCSNPVLRPWMLAWCRFPAFQSLSALSVKELSCLVLEASLHATLSKSWCSDLRSDPNFSFCHGSRAAWFLVYMLLLCDWVGLPCFVSQRCCRECRNSLLLHTHFLKRDSQTNWLWVNSAQLMHAYLLMPVLPELPICNAMKFLILDPLKIRPSKVSKSFRGYKFCCSSLWRTKRVLSATSTSRRLTEPYLFNWFSFWSLVDNFTCFAFYWAWHEGQER